MGKHKGVFEVGKFKGTEQGTEKRMSGGGRGEDRQANIEEVLQENRVDTTQPKTTQQNKNTKKKKKKKTTHKDRCRMKKKTLQVS